MHSRHNKLSTLRKGTDGTKIIFDNIQQALSFDYIQNRLGEIDIDTATQVALTCRNNQGYPIGAGEAVKLVGIDTDGMPLVENPSKGEGALIWGVNQWASDDDYTTTIIEPGQTGNIIISGYARRIKVLYHPTTGQTLNPGDSIYPYSGSEKNFTAYDSLGLFCGIVLEQKSTSYSDILFKSPALTIAKTPDGIVASRSTRMPSHGVGPVHGNLLKHAGTIYDSTGENLPNITNWVEGTDSADEILGIAPYNAVGRLAMVVNGQVSVPVNGSPAIGLPVYAEAGASSITTDSTSGIKVGTIINSLGSDWIVQFNL